MRAQPAVPLAFAVALATVALAGVGVGLAITPAGEGATAPAASTSPGYTTSSTVARAPVRQDSPGTVPLVRVVTGPVCQIRSRAAMVALAKPAFVAGTDSRMIGMVAGAFGTKAVVEALASLGRQVELLRDGGRGVVILAESGTEATARQIAQLHLPEAHQVIFLRLSSDVTDAPPTDYPSVLLVAGTDDETYATESAAMQLIHGGSGACRPLSAQSEGGPS